MNLLITGGAGYIGSKLVPYLAQQGHTITVVDKFDFGCNLDSMPGVTVRQLDVFDSTADDYRGFDTVIHLGGLSNDPMANFKPSDNFVQNLAGTTLVAYHAKQAGVPRFIFASSCSVYGKNDNLLLDESMVPAVDYPYGLSKIQSEHGFNYLSDDNFEIISLRQATVYGWAPRMRTDLVVNTMTKTAILDGAIYINDPRVSRPLIHVNDLVQVYGHVLNLPNWPKILNVSTGNYSLIEIAESVQRALAGSLPDLAVISRDLTDPRSYRVNNQLMVDLVGSWSYTTIEQSVAELISKIPVTDLDTWANPEYTNLHMYKQRIGQ